MNIEGILIKHELCGLKKLYDIESAAYEAMTTKMEDFAFDNKLPEWYIKALDAHKAVIDSLLESIKEKNLERAKSYAAYETNSTACLGPAKA